MVKFQTWALTLAIPISHAAAEPDAGLVSKGSDPASKQINEWFAAGTAAGLAGVYYDNRDRQHSDLGIASFPQLDAITYSDEERAARADWGAQTRVIPGMVIIGNSSTASPADQAGSHQRMLYIHPQGLPFLYEQYRSNALYIYPEHRDHDPGTNGPDGYGDLYPANSPYLISSQGSSGSDRVFMEAFLKAIAAFPPETREALISKGLLMPALQAIFRQTYKASDDYFSGSAHPSAFEGQLIDELAMAGLAHAMTADAIPPLVKLRVIEEPALIPGRDYFEPGGLMESGMTNRDSPCAIARVIRGPDLHYTMRVSAADSIDHRDRPLHFRWVVLRGDPALINIATGGEKSENATISVAYHPRRPIAPGSDMWSNRVDIGVFAEAAGSLPSAPAFISFTTLPNEHRTYTSDGKLLEISYGARSQDLGVPAAESGRWDALLTQLDPPTPAIGLLSSAIDEGQRTRLATTAAATGAQLSRIGAAKAELDAITTAQQGAVDATNEIRTEAANAHEKLDSEASKIALDKADTNHETAETALRDGAGGAAELKTEIAKLRSEITTSLRDNGVPEIVRDALDSIRTNHTFFSANEAAIRAGGGDRSPALATALQRLGSSGVRLSDDPPPNDRYHIEQMNLDILSDVLLPGFLERPPAPNYADPRLTAKKFWRDVYHHDAGGKRTGWTRFEAGGTTEFTAGGDIIQPRNPDGSPGEITAVRYQINPETGYLEATAIPE